MFKRILLTIILVILTISCSPKHKNHTPSSPPLFNEEDKRNIRKRLAEAAYEIEQATKELAESKAKNTSNPSTYLETTSVPKELRKVIKIDWSGPETTITKAIADQISYDFKILGTEPKQPIWVHISLQKTAIIKILENIGLQISPFAKLVVNSNTRKIELHYENA